MSLLWQYAIVEAGSVGDGHVGATGEPIELCVLGRVAAAYGLVDQPPALSERTLRAHHDAVLRLASAGGAILPTRYGESAPDLEALESRLRDRLDTLEAALERVRGRVQMTLRFFGESGPAPDAAPPRRPGAVESGRGYLERKRRARDERRDLPGAEPLLASLRAVATELRVEPSERAPLLGTAYALVDRPRLDEYRALVAGFRPREAKLRVTSTGPHPPFAFAAVREGGAGS